MCTKTTEPLKAVNNENSRLEMAIAFRLLIIASVISITVAEIPTRYYLGTVTYKMFKCYVEDRSSCVRFNTNVNPIKSLAASGEFIYAGMKYGEMWRCPLDTERSCSTLNRVNADINALAIGSIYLYAGLETGSIWQCPLDEYHSNQREQYHSCTTFYLATSSVKALDLLGTYLFVGLDNGQILKCDLEKKDSCPVIDVSRDAKINALSVLLEYVFVGLDNGIMWRCDHNKVQSCKEFDHADSAILSMNILGDHIYAGLLSGDIWECSREQERSCKSIVHHPEKAISLFNTYKTTEMLQSFKGENERCVWQDRSMCIPPVLYYNIKQRAPFELKIKNGKVYDSLGDLFDTSDADLSHTGHKAIFVMEPRGRIYASVKHPLYLVHDSSFLAGNPVAAAGELEVSNGVIRSITTCSGHYKPSFVLSSQVISSLRAQGYEDDLSITDCKSFKLVLDLNYRKISDD